MFAVLLAVLVSCQVELPAREQVLVAGAGGEWESKLLEALDAVGRSDYSTGVRILQGLISSQKGGMVRMPGSVGDLDRLRALLASPSRKQVVKPPPARPSRGPIIVRPGQLPRPQVQRFQEPAQVDREWGRYLQAARAARLVLGMLPAQGRSVYRKLYTEAASQLLQGYQQEGDRAVLEDVCRLYPLTAPGFYARELKADLAFEAGFYDKAWVGYRSVLEDSARDQPSPESILRLVEKALTCLRHSGRSALFSHEKERYSGFCRAAGAVAFERYGAVLKKLEKAGFQEVLPAQAGNVHESYWGGEVPGGAASPRLGAGGLPDLPGGPLEASWKSLDWASTVAIADNYDPLLNGGFARGQIFQPRGIDYPFVPLVRRNTVFLSGVYSIYEIDARPGVGKLLRQIPKPTPAGLRGRYREQSDSSLYTVTSWGGGRAVGADRFSGLQDLPDEILLSHYIAGFSRRRHYMGYDITVSIPTRSLAAFSRKSGELLWRTEDLRDAVQQDIYGPNEIPAEISYSSPVLVRDGLVFAGGWKQDGYINSLVRALDLRTGKTVWEVPVSSAQMEQTMFGELGREPFASFLTEKDGVLYYLSNLGAVAAIESRSGKVLWVTAYDYIKPPPTVGRFPRMRELRWGLNSPLLIGNVLVVAPRDSQYLLAIDTGRGPKGASREGEILWTYDNSAGDLRDLLGAHQGRLYFSGRDGIFALDISLLNTAGELAGSLPRSIPGARTKIAGLEETIDRLSRLPQVSRIGSPLVWEPDSIQARGLLTSSGVLYASRGQLETVGFDLRKRLRLLSRETAAGRLFKAGSPHIGGGQIIISSQSWLSAFSGPTF
ncbi:MAG: PQQ-binding-like beta-propeller repeat protein [Planctomycetota bacterium]|nr:PQQ-binding-like beta-propeller repeat protein [Planctomycetota bacterium]